MMLSSWQSLAAAPETREGAILVPVNRLTGVVKMVTKLIYALCYGSKMVTKVLCTIMHLRHIPIQPGNRAIHQAGEQPPVRAARRERRPLRCCAWATPSCERSCWQAPRATGATGGRWGVRGGGRSKRSSMTGAAVAWWLPKALS